MNLSTLAKLNETTTFVPHPDDPANKTLLTVESKLNIKSTMWGMSKVEGMSRKYYLNAMKDTRKKDAPRVAELLQEALDNGNALDGLLTTTEVQAKEEQEAADQAAERSGGDGEDEDGEFVSGDDSDDFYDADDAVSTSPVPAGDEGGGGGGGGGGGAQATGNPLTVPPDATPKNNPFAADATADAKEPEAEGATATAAADTADTEGPGTEANGSEAEATAAGADEAEASTRTRSISGGSTGDDAVVVTHADAADAAAGTRTRSISGGSTGGEDQAAADDSGGEAKKTSRWGRSQRMRGKLFWAASAATKGAVKGAIIAGRTAGKGAIIAKNQTVKTAKVVAKSQVVGKVKTNISGTIKASNERVRKTKRPKKAQAQAKIDQAKRASIYLEAAKEPYGWKKYKDAGGADYEMALRSRKMELETNWDDEDPEIKKEYKALDTAFDKMNEDKLTIDVVSEGDDGLAKDDAGVSANSADQQPGSSRSGMLTHFVSEMESTYADAPQHEVAAAVDSLTALLAKLRAYADAADAQEADAAMPAAADADADAPGTDAERAAPAADTEDAEDAGNETDECPVSEQAMPEPFSDV